MNYKRVFIQNNCVHLIIVAYNRKPIFIDNIDLLQKAIDNAMQYFQFEIVAFCILPDHIHIIIKPTDIYEYPKIITSIKYYFSKNFNVGVETPTYKYLNNDEKGWVETPTCKYLNNGEKGGVETPTYKYLNNDEKGGVETLTYGYLNKGEKGVFQRRYYEHTIISEEDLNIHVDYIHYNPIKHGYVKCAKDWEYSSFKEYVKNGFYDENWCNFEDKNKIKDLNYE